MQNRTRPRPLLRGAALRLGAALTLTALLGGTVACTGSPAQVAGVSAPAHDRTVVRDDLRETFEEAGVQGSFALLDVTAGRITVVDRARAERPLVPASTFKVPHSLIALETGVVKDENEVIPYGGKPQPFPEWERDMSMREAIRISNAAVYQTLAGRIGLRRERQWLHRLGYGNRRTGTALTTFWLEGPLKISATGQARWLSRLAAQRLPVSRDHQLTVRDMIKVEEKDGYALFAKSGWAFTLDPAVGWWAGWVERGGRVYSFALNIDTVTDADPAKRAPLARELLHRLGVLPHA